MGSKIRNKEMSMYGHLQMAGILMKEKPVMMYIGRLKAVFERHKLGDIAVCR